MKSQHQLYEVNKSFLKIYFLRKIDYLLRTAYREGLNENENCINAMKQKPVPAKFKF